MTTEALWHRLTTAKQKRSQNDHEETQNDNKGTENSNKQT